MQSSYKILTLSGISIEIHWSFLAFMFFLLLFSPVLMILLLLVFSFVTLHELCHSIIAIRNKIKVKKIILLPIGGMAVMNITRIKPSKEIKMAIAGPLFNFLMAGLLFILIKSIGLDFSKAFDIITSMKLSLELVLFYSYYANLLLGGFNLLLPAFPLDGGRILRAIIAYKTSYLKATLIARNISLGISITLLILSLLSQNYWISIISIFIMFGAISEYENLKLQLSLKRAKVKQLIRKDFLKVRPKEKILDNIGKLLEKGTLTVIVTSKPVKIADVRKIEKLTPDLTFDMIGVTAPRITPNSSLMTAFVKMQEKEVAMLPVFSGKRIIGVITLPDIERYRIIKSLLK